MKKSKAQIRAERIHAHGLKINALFGTDFEPSEICKKLHRLETQAHKHAENLCNIQNYQETADRELDKIEDKLDNLLNFRRQAIPVFINRDPRGYALKVKTEWMQEHGPYLRRTGANIETDWGGYGIICPEY